jgi:perosamine synthetase
MSGGAGRIPLARPALGDPELAAAERVLRSGRLVLGPETERFEEALAARTGRAHAIAVGSGTTALELSLWALGIGTGDRVLVPSFGFPAAANAAGRLGAEVVPVDVDPETWAMDPEAARAVAGGARALVAIDPFGLVADPAPLEALCVEHGLALIDDAACALGAIGPGGAVGGGYGVAATLSFHPRKLITTGEGGAVLCDDDALAARLRRLRNQGQSGRGVFPEPGTNARLAEIAAAIGTAQLARLDAMIAERRLLVEGYRRRLASLAAGGSISWQHEPAGSMHTYQTFAVVLADHLERDAVIRDLEAAGVEGGPATYAVHRLEAWAGLPAVRAGRFPVSDRLHDRGLALPLYVGMRTAELEQVCEALDRVLQGGPA